MSNSFFENFKRYFFGTLGCVFLIVFASLCHGQETIQSIAHPEQTAQDILKDPKHRPKANTYYLLALSAAKKGNNTEAFAKIETGLHIEPNNVNLLNLRAALWSITGKTPEAIAEFKRIVSMFPDNEYARCCLSNLEGPKIPVLPPPCPLPKAPREASASSEVASGTETASSPRKLESSYFDEMSMKQRCYYAMALIKRAKKNQESEKPDTKGKFDSKSLVEGKYLAAFPICPEGGTYSWKDDAPSCSKHGDFSPLETEVNLVFTDFNAGMKAKFSRNFPEAKGAFKKVINLFPNWIEAHYQLADTLFRLGEDKYAIEELKTCLKINPKHLDAKLLLANLYFKTGHKDSALHLLEEVLAKFPESIHAISAKSIIAAIKSGKNYYQIFPPD